MPDISTPALTTNTSIKSTFGISISIYNFLGTNYGKANGFKVFAQIMWPDLEIIYIDFSPTITATTSFSTGGIIWDLPIPSLGITNAINVKPVVDVTIPSSVCTTYTGIIANINPYFYVVDSGNNRIQAFYYDGTYTFSFGEYGTGDGQFNNPYGIATDNTYLYVTDTGNNRVQVFDLKGNFKFKIVSEDPLYEFNNPLGIAVDNDFIYVVNNGNNELLLFSLAGEFIAKYGRYGSCDTCFDDPTDIRVDSEYIYVEDVGNNRTVVIPKSTIPVNYVVELLPLPQSEYTVYIGSVFNQESPIDFSLISEYTVEQSSVIRSMLPTLQDLLLFIKSIYNENKLPSIISSIETAPNFVITSQLPTFSDEIYSTSVYEATLSSSFKLQDKLSAIHGIVSQIDSKLLSVLSELDYRQGNIFDIRSSLIKVFSEYEIIPELLATISNNLSPIWSNIEIITKSYLTPENVKVICFNLKSEAVTEFTNFNFNSIIKHNGNYLTSNENGLYIISGNTDDGEPIEIDFTLGRMNLQDGGYFIPLELLLEGTNVDLTLAVLPYLSDPVNISIKAPTPERTKVKLPKGLKGKILNYRFIKDTTSNFRINSLKFYLYKVSKRKR